LFRVLLRERHWDNWVVFCSHFEKTARALARETHSARLAHVTVGRRTFGRWFKGEWQGRPQTEAAQVLERLLGFPCAELFAPVRDVSDARDSVHDRSGSQVSMVISKRWPTSRLFLSSAEGVADLWELAGQNVLDGTTSAVHFLPAGRRDDAVSLHIEDTAALQRFLRPARRGLLVGVERRADDLRLYVIDSVNAKRCMAAFVARDGQLSFPAAHELDDLTYGILWALVQFDDGLLAVDQALEEEHQVLDTYLQLPRSAPSRMAVPILTTVGVNWLGSAFCALHIQRRLNEASDVPLFWTREQSGEEAATWLFFRHKVAYLHTLRRRFGGTVNPLARGFCIPEAAVARSSSHERPLLFLAIALMEMTGIRVQITARPEYAEVDGFALVPGQRAVVANWVRTEALWRADTTTARADLRGYHETFNEASERNLLHGSDSEERLRILADYLGLDWHWLVHRCRALGECGVSSLIRPRSRLISVDALDDVLRFLGTLAPDR
jgi:hypothetical protein